MSFADSSDGLGVLLGGFFFKANKDITENKDKQMKHMMYSFEAQKEEKMTKKEINKEEWNENELRIRNK